MAASPLVGKWFHSVEGETIKWQGEILAKINDGLFLVQLFSWISGDITEQKLVRLEDMLNWYFYDSNEIMNDRYYNRHRYDVEEKLKKEEAFRLERIEFPGSGNPEV